MPSAQKITTFQLEGQEFIALNGGPQFKFTEAISLSVNCETQKEACRGGEEGPCGWLKDKFGLSWQINPTVLGKKKIDIKKLQQAYDQG